MDADSARTRPTDAQVIANAPASEVSIHQLHVPLVDLRAQSLVVRDRLIAALESKATSRYRSAN